MSTSLLSPLSRLPEPSEGPRPHRTGKGFRNAYSNDDTGLWGFLKWRWDRLLKHAPVERKYVFPLACTDVPFLLSNRTETTLTWIGHATVLLQLKGKNILTDPQFSERASPFRWIGPKRVVKPGLDLVELPPIDAVLISHDHYDSLDTKTIERLLRRHGGERIFFFVPLGLASWFRATGAKNVIELDWWETHEAHNLGFTAVPAHHWSKRALVPRNRTLWAGWVVAAPDFRFYFAGDSGYQPIFKEIGQRMGPFDLSAIPIGSYEPRWFMKYHHLSPDEAVKVHLDVKSKRSIGIHWGTFPLSDEPLDEPPLRLQAAMEREGVPDSEIRVLKHGETIVMNGH